MSSRLNQSPENMFDMKKLEQELFAIQQGGTVGDECAIDDADNQEEEGEDNDNDSDNGDPFNRFWGVVEPMVNKLSQTSSPQSLSPTQQQFDSAFSEAETNRIQHEMSFISESFFCPSKDSGQIQITNYPQSDTKSIHEHDEDPENENSELKSQIAAIKNEIQSLQQVNFFFSSPSI